MYSVIKSKSIIIRLNLNYRIPITHEAYKIKSLKSNYKFMKAISIKQPCVSLIAHGIKDIENRTWKCLKKMPYKY